jgi:hypothetical protein
MNMRSTRFFNIQKWKLHFLWKNPDILNIPFYSCIYFFCAFLICTILMIYLIKLHFSFSAVCYQPNIYFVITLSNIQIDRFCFWKLSVLDSDLTYFYIFLFLLYFLYSKGCNILEEKQIFNKCFTTIGHGHTISGP